MNWKDMEGQMDFLGLISEYTDAQGATVRVREPGVKRSRPIPPPKEVEQLSFDFDMGFAATGIQGDADTCIKEENGLEPQSAPEDKSETKKEPKVKKEPEAKKDPEARKAPEAKKEPEAKKDPKVKQESGVKQEPEVKKKTVAKNESEVKPETETNEEPVAKTETKPETEKENKLPEVPEKMLFKQCKRCWCYDCRHNSRNEAVPREMCGMMMPCPACDGCVSEDMATICEIGNAQEGCMTRALEEGFIKEEL